MNSICRFGRFLLERLCSKAIIYSSKNLDSELNQSCFDALPQEIVATIFSWNVMNLNEFRSASLVCRKWHKIATDNCFWRLKHVSRYPSVQHAFMNHLITQPDLPNDYYWQVESFHAHLKKGESNAVLSHYSKLLPVIHIIDLRTIQFLDWPKFIKTVFKISDLCPNVKIIVLPDTEQDERPSMFLIKKLKELKVVQGSGLSENIIKVIASFPELECIPN